MHFGGDSCSSICGGIGDDDKDYDDGNEEEGAFVKGIRKLIEENFVGIQMMVIVVVVLVGGGEGGGW